MGRPILLRKIRNSARDVRRFAQKAIGTGATILTKAGQTGGAVLDAGALIAPELAFTPMWAGARAAAGAAQILGNAGTSLVNAKDVPQAAGSIRDAYGAVRPAVIRQGVGSETLTTALS